MTQMTKSDTQQQISLAYREGWADAVKEAIDIVRGFDVYDPYIVGKMKIEERKGQLVARLMELLE